MSGRCVQGYNTVADGRTHYATCPALAQPLSALILRYSEVKQTKLLLSGAFSFAERLRYSSSIPFSILDNLCGGKEWQSNSPPSHLPSLTTPALHPSPFTPLTPLTPFPFPFTSFRRVDRLSPGRCGPGESARTCRQHGRPSSAPGTML